MARFNYLHCPSSSLRNGSYVQQCSRQDDVLLQVLGYRVEKLLLGQPLPGEKPVGISVGTVAEDGDDSVALSELLGNLLRSYHVQARAGTKVQAFLVKTAVDHEDGLLVGNVHRIVNEVDVGLQVVRDATLADALSDGATGPLRQFSAALDVRMQHRARGIRQERLDSPVRLLLQVPGHTSQSSSRARGASESIDLASSLVPDLGAGGLNVCLAIGDVVKLVCPHGVVQALGVPLCLVVVVLRVLEGDGRNGIDFSTQQSKQIDLALRLSVWHVDDQFVALGAAHVGKANASVAGGALDDGAARLQQALLLGILDDVESGAVLDGTTGILELGLSQNLTSRLLGETLQADERSLADSCGQASADNGLQTLAGSHTVNEAPLGDSLGLGDANGVLLGGLDLRDVLCGTAGRCGEP